VMWNRQWQGFQIRWWL